MRCLIALGITLAASTALASEERIAVFGNDPGAAQIKESICISEDCVFSAAHPDWIRAEHEGLAAAVTAKQVKGQLEIAVHSADGAVRFKKSVAVGEGGTLGVTELVSATTAIVHAIEYPADAKAEAKKAAAEQKKADKLASAKRHGKSAKKVAVRKSSKSAARG